jgi:hypothetical protein
MAAAAGVEAKKVHVPSDLIRAHDASWGDGLIGDKAHSMIFDNTKLKRLVPGFAAAIPFSRGAQEIIAWYDANPRRKHIDEAADRIHDLLIEKMRSIWPSV